MVDPSCATTARQILEVGLFHRTFYEKLRSDRFESTPQALDDFLDKISASPSYISTSLPLTVPGWEVEKEQGEALIPAADDNSRDGLENKLGGDPI